jgi:DNA-3-methyladenine glycosylase
MNSTIKEQTTFWDQDTLSLARALLGCQLVCDRAEGRTSGLIVETEAYLRDDPACHAYTRQTARNAPMFGPSGMVYVYQIYGMYHCVNIASGGEGIGEAVLIRALAPVDGVDLMRQRRQEASRKPQREFKDTELCKGPGCLVQALGIDKSMNGWMVQDSDLKLIVNLEQEFDIVQTTRIGLSKGADLPYRFYVKNHPSVSRKG